MAYEGQGHYNGNFDRRGRPVRDRARQDWFVGAVVTVGFMKGLRVVERTETGWTLVSSKGAKYDWRPHEGLCKL